MKSNKKEIGKVIESTQSCISIIIDNEKLFEDNKNYLQIGKYLKVQEGNNNYLVGGIQNIKLGEVGENNKYIIQIQPIGILTDDMEFIQGGIRLPSPTERAFLMGKEELEKIFSKNEQFSFQLGKLTQNHDIKFYVNGNKFFSKHIAIVGSTGSGKSCAVSKILQDVVGIEQSNNVYKESKRNSHIIIFDIHSEYKKAFFLDEQENFNLNILDIESLKLPYWLMNSEELESLFIESGEQNSHNQISQFKQAVIMNKCLHNPSVEKITYDTPVYFDINEVYNFIYNQNYGTKIANTGEIAIDQIDSNIEEIYENYKKNTSTELSSKYRLFGKVKFKSKSTGKINGGAYAGEFDRFISRLETKLNDKRLDFLLKPVKDNGELYKSDDFEIILKQFLGYLDKSNVTIIDLSGVPFEVLSITISLISRLVFDFAFHYSKLKHSKGEKNDIPFMIICEEAHNYIPKNGASEYKASRKSIERIAKEGRKYGLSLMVVSQRPSEVSDTIFSQCNNFVVLRLTNVNDQNYVKNLLPNNTSAIADILPTLSCGECLIVGDAVPLTSVVKLDKPNPEPESESIEFHTKWLDSWQDVTFGDVIRRWKKDI